MSVLKNWIAFKGLKFTVEWYHTTDGKSKALEYFNGLDREDKIKTMNLFELMASEGKILNIQKFRHEGDGIYAFKPKPHRFMCFFFIGKKIIVTNGFEKKKDELPKKEKEQAKKYKEDYEERFKLGKII